jgi:hypothetical protein
MTWTDTALREYLLGTSSEETAERIEARVLEDGDLFAALEAAEDDLFDAYARGTLSPQDRSRFLERFGHRADRLRFAEAFGRQTAAARRPPAARRPWIPLAAAAALVLAAGIAYTRLEAPAPDSTPPPQAHQVQPSTPSSSNPLPAPPAAPSGPFAVALTLGTSRSADSTTAITVPAGTAVVQVNVRLDPADRFDRYAMELRGAGDRAVWNGGDLTATATSGTLTVSARIPAEALPAGSYELVVRGGGTDLGFIPLTVRWSP